MTRLGEGGVAMAVILCRHAGSTERFSHVLVEHEGRLHLVVNEDRSRWRHVVSHGAVWTNTNVALARPVLQDRLVKPRIEHLPEEIRDAVGSWWLEELL